MDGLTAGRAGGLDDCVVSCYAPASCDHFVAAKEMVGAAGSGQRIICDFLYIKGLTIFHGIVICLLANAD